MSLHKTIIMRRAKIVGFHECIDVVRDGVIADKNYGRLEEAHALNADR